jgi:hypothetical protein
MLARLQERSEPRDAPVVCKQVAADNDPGGSSFESSRTVRPSPPRASRRC